MQPLNIDVLATIRNDRKEVAHEDIDANLHDFILRTMNSSGCSSHWIFLSIFTILTAITMVISRLDLQSYQAINEVGFDNLGMNETERQQAAFDLALARFRTRSKGMNTFLNLYEMGPNKEKLLNTIRIPKAGSSHLSMVARALAGCHPDGYPCCRGPSRSCPRGDLLCPTIIGCVDHRPKYDALDLPLITALREPSSRLLSGFFYSPPHRPKPKDDYSWSMFETYVKSPEFRNVITKMLSTAKFAYHEFQPGEHTIAKAQERLCSFEWFAINEFPILSALLLYESSYFAQIQPNRVVFGLGYTADSKAAHEKSYSAGMRIHSDSTEYHVFKTITYIENNGSELIRQFNQEDIALYDWAVGLFCARVQEKDLMQASEWIATSEVLSCRRRRPHVISDFCTGN